MQDIQTLKVIGKYTYSPNQCLGQGSFGKVFQGFQNITKLRVAIKKVDFKLFEKDSYLQQSIFSQIKILNKFKHPNIVQLYEVLNSKRSIYIVMQFCGDGDLKKYLRLKGRIPEQQAHEIMKQIALGFRELQKMKIIHRDLKPANVLINNGMYKLCDFGFAKYVDSAQQLLKSCVGSPLYMAPQILDKVRYTYKCDIWSFGVIYFEILHGSVPWRGSNEVELLKNIKSIPVKLAECFSEPVAKFIRTLLVIPEDKRATWQDVFAYFNIKDTPSSPTVPPSPPRLQQSPSKSRPYTPTTATSTATIATSSQDSYFGLTSSFFEELAFRSFVCADISSKLHQLNRYNFTKHLFEKFMLLLSSSVKYRFQKLKSIIDIITDMVAVQLIRKQWNFQEQFFGSLVEGLQDTTCGQEIRKEAEWRPLIEKGIVRDGRLYQGLFKQLATTAVNELEQEVQESQGGDEKALLLSVIQNICDMFVANSHLTKTHSISFSKIFAQRNEQPDLTRSISKISEKAVQFRKCPPTSFFD